MSHQFPSLTEVLAIHSVLIEEFGGHRGIRDEGALLSALLRPHLGYYEGLIEKAAALLESLVVNHPFVDGNKRVAFAVTDVFLRSNGAFIDCENDAAFAHFTQLFATNSFKFEQIRIWLHTHAKDLPERRLTPR